MSLRTGLLAAFGYVLLLAIVSLGVPLALSLSARVNDEVRSQASEQADLVAATAADLLTPARRGALQTLVRSAAVTVRGRVLVVDRDGSVLADSAEPPQLGVSYAARPEIARALRGRQLQVQRSSRTLAEQILATAVPILRNGAPVGATRITQSIAAVHSAVRRAELGIVLIGVTVLALGMLVGAVISAQVARPLVRLERIAKRIADGELGARASIEGSREQRSLVESFNEMTERVQRLLVSQRAFVADASHQLRTPLTALRLRLEAARSSAANSPTVAELDLATNELDRLAQIVEELLVLSRAGERELPGELIELDRLVAEAVRRWRRLGARRGVGLLAGPSHGGTAWCSQIDAERSLDALIENAILYSPSKTVVSIAAAPGTIEVCDQGPGLAPGERHTVFERFHRGSAGRAGPPGSGLGLSIARELARSWGGEVTLDNQTGGGCIARLRLPAQRG